MKILVLLLTTFSIALMGCQGEEQNNFVVDEDGYVVEAENVVTKPSVEELSDALKRASSLLIGSEYMKFFGKQYWDCQANIMINETIDGKAFTAEYLTKVVEEGDMFSHWEDIDKEIFNSHEWKSGNALLECQPAGVKNADKQLKLQYPTQKEINQWNKEQQEDNNEQQ